MIRNARPLPQHIWLQHIAEFITQISELSDTVNNLERASPTLKSIVLRNNATTF